MPGSASVAPSSRDFGPAARALRAGTPFTSRPGGTSWVTTDPELLLETEAWGARQRVGETVQVASPILAPAIGRLGYRLAREKRFTDPLALDANYVRRSDAEAFWQDGPGRQHNK